MTYIKSKQFISLSAKTRNCSNLTIAQIFASTILYLFHHHHGLASRTKIVKVIHFRLHPANALELFFQVKSSVRGTVSTLYTRGSSAVAQHTGRVSARSSGRRFLHRSVLLNFIDCHASLTFLVRYHSTISYMHLQCDGHPLNLTTSTISYMHIYL